MPIENVVIITETLPETRNIILEEKKNVLSILKCSGCGIFKIKGLLLLLGKDFSALFVSKCADCVYYDGRSQIKKKGRKTLLRLKETRVSGTSNQTRHLGDGIFLSAFR